MKLKQIGIVVGLLLITSSGFAGGEYKKIVTDLIRNIENPQSSIAVVGFSYSDGRDSRDGIVISERITTELVKLKKFTVVERKELEKVLQELKLGQTGLIDINSTQDIGKMVGAESVIVGTLTEMPDGKLELNARIVAVGSGTVISAISSEIKKDWLDQYKQLLIKETKSIEKNPKDAETFYQRGVTNYDLEEYDKAIADFGVSVSLNPAYADAYLNRGFAYSQKQEYEKSAKDFSKVLELSPLSSKAYLGRGMAYFFKGMSNECIEDLNKAIALNPTFKSAYINRGAAYFARKDNDNAIKDFNTVIELDPVAKYAYLNRGSAYREKGNYDKALEDYNKVLKIDPKHATAYSTRARVYVDRGEYSKAIEDANAALKITNNISFYSAREDAYCVRGDAYALSGELDKAIKDFTQAIEISPSNDEYYTQRAGAYSNKGEYGLAIIDLTNAIARIKIPRDGPGVYPGYSEIFVSRGALYYGAMKDYVKAIEDFSSALLFDPKNTDTLTRRSWAYVQKGDFKNGDLDMAIADVSSAIEIKPNDSELYVLRGIQYDAFGKFYSTLGNADGASLKYRKALNDYEMAIKLNPTRHEGLKIKTRIGKIKARFGGSMGPN
ncbi:MAG: tetratricopeptide repeat protein [Elusimicrobia bacterium]|nr:tetratricopeptide repeat protein [Elusimicrobiota bacterium]